MNTALSGLSQNEVAEQLKTHGFNELPPGKKRGLVALAFEVVREPMVVLLVMAGSVYFAVGDHLEALLLFASIVVVVGIELYQDVHTERALDALRDLSSPRALVIREGKPRRIAGREVVPGDLVVLEEGDRVPADGLVVHCTNLTVDESLLTGESLPVAKIAATGADNERGPGGAERPSVYSGTLVTAGQGIAQITATGSRSEVGRIGKALETLQPERTPLQRELDHIVGILARLALGICGLVVVGYGLTRGNWLEGLLAGISAAMSLIPEEFPIVLAVFLALGAARIAKSNVLTRRTAAIEALGAATVLCADKTGTLTLNRMALRKIVIDEVECDLGETAEPLSSAVHGVIAVGARASRPTAVDPMDRAICLSLDDVANRDRDEAGWRLVREYSLSPGQPTMANVWQMPEGDSLVVAAKGAPEAIAVMCRLAHPERLRLEASVAALADNGFRVLGVAQAVWPSQASLPDHQQDFAFRLIGLLGFADPLRPGVPAAVQEAYQAGIRVVMLTGDSPHTARTIARQIGLHSPDCMLTGVDLDVFSDAKLREQVRTVNVFARVIPEQKLRLVEALKANGEVVAMTGDGVNDAPALKAAHIGIAMGGRGTDVAREAAPLVLLDDDFASIVQAVRVGRRIYDNLRKSMTFLLAVHIPIAGLALAPVLAYWPLLLLPAHIVLLEFIVDPACSIVFEREQEEPDVMRRPPRDPSAPLFSRQILKLASLQGAIILLVALVLYALGQAGGEDRARAITFTTLVIAFLGLIVSNRSFSESIPRSLLRPNAALWWSAGGVLLVTTIALSVPVVRELFRFAAMDGPALLTCFAASALVLISLEGLEAMWRRLAGTATVTGR